jgi:sulfite reductase alpha subunit-like flavoprotein
MAPTKIVIIHGGELAKDVAEQVEALKPSDDFDVTLRCASERPKTLLNLSDAVLCFVMQTIENEAPTEEGGSVVRFFKRKTHPSDLLESSGLSFAVLGLGDSNLLLDRQTTAAKDCNQVAQQLDSRLEALGGKRVCPLGMADERTGLTEVEPWIKDVFWKSLS